MEHKIIEYIIAESITSYGLTNLVNNYIKKGYEPFGSIAIALKDNNTFTYVQPVIKKI